MNTSSFDIEWELPWMKGTKIRRRVVCAAVRAADGEIIIGIRHYCTTMNRLIASRPDGEKFKNLPGNAQGFVDQWGNFLSRQEAFLVARANNQLLSDRHDVNDEELYSESIY